MDSIFSGQSALGRRWQSTTFRLITLYTLLFSVSVMMLLGYIGLSVTKIMENETDVVLKWQLIYFDSMPVNELPEAILRRLEREHAHTKNFYGLFDASGKHIAGDVMALPPSLAIVRHGRTIDHMLDIAGKEQAPVVRAMAEPRADGETLLIARDLTHILRIRETIFNALIAGGVLCLVAGVLGGLVLSVRQVRRIKAIRRVTQRIAEGDLGQRLPIGGRDEIDMLAHLVNHMLDEVERLMNEVKGACDGIAHDLRTPLAHVRTLLLHMAQRSSTYQDKALQDLIDNARRETEALLDRFRAMLRISEIGTLQRRGGFGEVDLESLIQEVGELFEPLAESRKIGFTVQSSPVDAIHGDRALVFEALTNLLDNAIKFTPDGGNVRLELKRMPSGARIDVIDDGPGIPVQERDAVLQRFYRGERTRHLAGSGLGLSIVSAVVNVHDFEMHINDAELGTHITIECWTKTLA